MIPNQLPQRSIHVQHPQAGPAVPMTIPLQIRNTRSSDTLQMEMNYHNEPDAFRKKYYQTLAHRRHSGQSAAKEIPSNTRMVLNNNMAGSPTGHSVSSQLSRSAPMTDPIIVQRSAPINIPTTSRQSAREWSYAYARNSQHENHKFYMNPKTHNNISLGGFNQRYKNHNQLLGNDDEDEQELDIFHQFDPNNDDDDDSISLASKELSTKFYLDKFPLTHSVDFEL